MGLISLKLATKQFQDDFKTNLHINNKFDNFYPI